MYFNIFVTLLQWIFGIFFVLTMFLYMPPVLGLLWFTHRQKAAFVIWCHDLTTEFHSAMLNLPAFFLPVDLNAEDVAERRELVGFAFKFSISSKCFSSVPLNFWQGVAVWVIAADEVVFSSVVVILSFLGSNLKPVNLTWLRLYHLIIKFRKVRALNGDCYSPMIRNYALG